MPLLHQKSPECTLAELDLFNAPMTQLSIEDKNYQECQPLSALSDNSPEFFIPRDGEKYLDLNDTLLHLQVKITNADGSNIPPDVAVGLINYPFSTIFSQCQVTLGDRLMLLLLLPLLIYLLPLLFWGHCFFFILLHVLTCFFFHPTGIHHLIGSLPLVTSHNHIGPSTPPTPSNTTSTTSSTPPTPNPRHTSFTHTLYNILCHPSHP